MIVMPRSCSDAFGISKTCSSSGRWESPSRPTMFSTGRGILIERRTVETRPLLLPGRRLWRWGSFSCAGRLGGRLTAGSSAPLGPFGHAIPLEAIRSTVLMDHIM